MEQFVSQIQTYADAAGRTPQAVLRAAVGASWGTWAAWLAGKSSPTMAVADRVRDYMAANPPAPEQKDVA